MKNFEKFKTAEERAAAFDKFCKDRTCDNCPLKDRTFQYHINMCCLYWLELEEDHEKPLPCPCCGNIHLYKHDDIHNPKAYVICNDCGYRSPWEMNIDVAVARHNELCRKWGTSKPIEDLA